MHSGTSPAREDHETVCTMPTARGTVEEGTHSVARWREAVGNLRLDGFFFPHENLGVSSVSLCLR